ncbi:MAG: hypothetical protein LBU32_07840 [Clostridiales bacterium]|nr:hypothetical protein [Clostridiales bacterium]
MDDAPFARVIVRVPATFALDEFGGAVRGGGNGGFAFAARDYFDAQMVNRQLSFLCYPRNEKAASRIPKRECGLPLFVAVVLRARSAPISFWQGQGTAPRLRGINAPY